MKLNCPFADECPFKGWECLFLPNGYKGCIVYISEINKQKKEEKIVL